MSANETVIINGRTHWQQWDIQVARRNEQLAYIELNNLYLAVERGCTRLNVSTANRLRVLVTEAYPGFDDMLQDWWLGEFEKLPGWLDV